MFVLSINLIYFYFIFMFIKNKNQFYIINKMTVKKAELKSLFQLFLQSLYLCKIDFYFL